jgi:uncharacterized PurR-regulated membrane protein YhhQ (DUF165 family)
MTKRAALLAIVVYAAAIVGANYMLERFGFVEFLGLATPAGTFLAAVTFTARDVVHEGLGRWWTLVPIAIGGLLSLAVSPAFAVASAVAFLFGELADLGVYDPLRRRHWTGAGLAAGAGGAVADTVLFLRLAVPPGAGGASLLELEGIDAVVGTTVAKVAVVAATWAVWRLVRRPAVAETEDLVAA